VQVCRASKLHVPRSEPIDQAIDGVEQLFEPEPLGRIGIVALQEFIWRRPMSDPRNIDPRNPDPRRPPDTAQRRLWIDDGPAIIWGWIGALAAIAVVFALMVAYHNEARIANSDIRPDAPPSTTGAAPSAPARPPLVNRIAPDAAAPTPPASAPSPTNPIH
jgi:hypothetical protein